MRNYSGTDNRDPDAIQKIDYFLRDVAAAMGRIEKGQVPSGSGTTVVIAGGGMDHGALDGLGDDDHAQYALLAGRNPSTSSLVEGQGIYGQALYGYSGTANPAHGQLALIGSPRGMQSSYMYGGSVKIGHALEIMETYTGTSTIPDALWIHLGNYESGGGSLVSKLYIGALATGQKVLFDFSATTLTCRALAHQLRHTELNTYRNDMPLLSLLPTTNVAFTNDYFACIRPDTLVKVAGVNRSGMFYGDGSMLKGIGTEAGVVTLVGAQTIYGAKTFAPIGTDDCLNLTPTAGDCIVGTPGSGDIERFTTGANNVWRVLNTGEVAMGNVLTLYPTPGGSSYFSLTPATLNGARTGYLPNVNGTFIMVGSGNDPAGAAGTISVVNRTGITAVIGTSVKLTNTSAAGFYIINVSMACTVAGTGGVQLNIIYTSDAGAKTIPIAALPMTATTQLITGFQTLYLASGDITWTTSGTFTGTHNLRIRAVYLGA